MADISQITLPNNEVYNIKDATARAAIIPMTVLSYGKSTWNDFITAYNSNTVIYCRASAESNPATGLQTRMAFMAYVNNEESPTEVEFQYYRSIQTHSNNQQGDQVFVYKLNSSDTWTVTTRQTFTKIVAGTGLSGSYSSGALTLSSTQSGGTYTLSISNNVITLTGSDSSTSSITLPVYNGSVSSGGGS